MILIDNETKVDLLNNEAIAKTIVELLREKPDHSVTIGVHGDWAAGKSSVLEMIDCTCITWRPTVRTQPHRKFFGGAQRISG